MHTSRTQQEYQTPRQRRGFTSGVRKHTKDSIAGGQYRRKQTHLVPARAGFTLLLSVLVASIVLAIGLAILNITLKEFQLSNLARESEKALYAADAGLECIIYWDQSTADGNTFDVPHSGASATCMGQPPSTTGAASSGTAQEFEYTWGTPQVCAKVTMVKHQSDPGQIMSNRQRCPDGVECTDVLSRGYNKACDQLDTPHTVERAIRARY